MVLLSKILTTKIILKVKLRFIIKWLLCDLLDLLWFIYRLLSIYILLCINLTWNLAALGLLLVLYFILLQTFFQCITNCTDTFCTTIWSRRSNDCYMRCRYIHLCFHLDVFISSATCRCTQRCLSISIRTFTRWCFWRLLSKKNRICVTTALNIAIVLIINSVVRWLASRLSGIF